MGPVLCLAEDGGRRSPGVVPVGTDRSNRGLHSARGVRTCSVRAGGNPEKLCRNGQRGYPAALVPQDVHGRSLQAVNNVGEPQRWQVPSTVSSSSSSSFSHDSSGLGMALPSAADAHRLVCLVRTLRAHCA